MLKAVIPGEISKRTRYRMNQFQKRSSKCFFTDLNIEDARIIYDTFGRLYINSADLHLSSKPSGKEDLKSCELYLNIWTTDNKDTSLTSRCPIYFITGACLFGNTLYGIDINKNRTELVRLFVGEEVGGTETIADVIKDEEQHPYVCQLLEELRQWTEMCKLIASQRNVEWKMYIHVPTAEYLMIALFYYFDEVFTKEALMKYIKLLVAEAQWIIQKIQSINSDFKIFSPLQEWMDGLFKSFLDDLSETKHNFLSSLYLDFNSNIVSNRFRDIIRKLCSFKEFKVWDQAMHCSDVKVDNLRDLALLSYVLAIPLINQQDISSHVWLCDVYYEIPIALKYRRIFQEIYGPLICLHWLPLTCIHDPPKNILFCLPICKKDLLLVHQGGDSN